MFKMNIFSVSSESIKPKLSKIRDILLWTIYTNVIDHGNIRYGHIVDLYINRRCKNICFKDYFFLQKIFCVYGAFFKSADMNEVLNYSENIAYLSSNEKTLLKRNIYLFFKEGKISYTNNKFITLYRHNEIGFSDLEDNLITEDLKWQI